MCAPLIGATDWATLLARVVAAMMRARIVHAHSMRCALTMHVVGRTRRAYCALPHERLWMLDALGLPRHNSCCACSPAQQRFPPCCCCSCCGGSSQRCGGGTRAAAARVLQHQRDALAACQRARGSTHACVCVRFFCCACWWWALVSLPQAASCVSLFRGACRVYHHLPVCVRILPTRSAQEARGAVLCAWC